MDIELFNQSLHLAAKLVERGDYEDALLVLRPWLDTPLSGAHKGIVCVNLAVVSDLQGRTETALAWYERGAGYDRAEGRVFVAEQQAAYLAGKGRRRESLALYESLLRGPILTAEERRRIEHNVATLRDGA
jgi:predicted negative regulator of RcsB-dependent stress response